jgi:uncharacterized protein YqjF (DUF2071 family)
MSSPGRFLTAAWRYLVMANYEVDPAVLRPLVPRGTELDEWQGRTVVSMVGFRFLDTRVLGVPIPFHRDFDEVNLRFYVRREGPEGWRRGVVFIKELVPRAAIAWLARVVYNENYVALPMRHDVRLPEEGTAHGGGRGVGEGAVAYEWRSGGRWNRLAATVAGAPSPLAAGSEAEFITEHYWGYARQRDGGTVEYQVEHPPWRVWSAAASTFDCDVDGLYGAAFAAPLTASPRSAFVAEGSPVTVRRGVRLPTG